MKDNGVLLEEESLTELEQKSGKRILFTVSDTAQAARLLERMFHEKNFSVDDISVCLLRGLCSENSRENKPAL